MVHSSLLLPLLLSLFLVINICKTEKEFLITDNFEEDLEYVENENLHAQVKYFYISNEKRPRVPFDNTTLYLINNEYPVKLIIHGWMVNSSDPFIADISNSYLSILDYNIIHVDWGVTAHKQYLDAAYLTKNLGDMIGNLIIKIHFAKSVPLCNFHILGHSLGGQVAGLIGKRVQSLMGGVKIGRISGFDPAGPYFVNVTDDLRLAKTDADMVDVTHTDGGYLGYFDACGTIDFYPNGGVAPQPGCSPSVINSTNWIDVAMSNSSNCSHEASYHYFNYSILAYNLKGSRCYYELEYKTNLCIANEIIVYGDNAPRFAEGIFYFKTNGKAPFRNV